MSADQQSCRDTEGSLVEVDQFSLEMCTGRQFSPRPGPQFPGHFSAQPGPQPPSARPAGLFANVRHYRIGCFSQVGFVVIHILYNRTWFITYFCSLQSSSIRRSAGDHSKLTWPNYLLIVSKIFKSAGCQTTAWPAASHSPGRGLHWAGPGGPQAARPMLISSSVAVTWPW